GGRPPRTPPARRAGAAPRSFESAGRPVSQCGRLRRGPRGPRPDARTAWSGANPLKKGPGTPVVLVDADWDPPAKPLNGRLAAAAAGLLVALGGGAAWLGISSIPASPPSREPVASAPAPATAVPPMAPSASSDTFLPPARDAAP